MSVHQIYCTHCTHGSSALERREGELAHRIFGYSARAGSLEAMDLRRLYRQVEPYVYYYLPRDTPSEQRLRLTAATAPRRLFFIPSAGGLQLLGQVCYRQTDSEGRPGSYFAHVLLQDERTAPRRWNALDCLRLWGAAGWTQEDSPSIPFRLNPLAGIDDLLAGRPPAIDDRVLWSFLTAPGPETEFHDPGDVIPRRWRQMTPQIRTGWLVAALQALLQTNTAIHESLALVAEPSISALLFYGIARLVPETIRNALSFSTFDPQPDRAGTLLGATWFTDVEDSSRRPDAPRVRGVTVNTLNGLPSAPSAPAQYASMTVALLLAKRWEAVDKKLAAIGSSGAARFEDLNRIAEVDGWASDLLAGRQVPRAVEPNQSMEYDYLRKTLAAALAKHGTLPVRGSPSHRSVLELLAAEPEIPGTRAVVDGLLESLPESMIWAFLHSRHVSQGNKLRVLTLHVRRTGKLPEGCEELWNAGESPAGEASVRRPGLIDLLGNLDEESLLRLFQNAREKHANCFLSTLLHVHCHVKPMRSALGRVAYLLTEAEIQSLYRENRSFFDQYPSDEGTLSWKLAGMAEALPDDPELFSQRLDMLLGSLRLLRPEHASRVRQWDKCRQAILDIGGVQDFVGTQPRARQFRRLSDATRRMAEAVAVVLPSPPLRAAPAGAAAQGTVAGGDDHLSREQERDALFEAQKARLRRIAITLLGGRELLPESKPVCKQLWLAVRDCSFGEPWVRTSGRRSLISSFLSGVNHPRVRVWGAVVLGALIAVAVILGIWRTVGGPHSPGPGRAGQPADPAPVPMRPGPKERKRASESQPRAQDARPVRSGASIGRGNHP